MIIKYYLVALFVLATGIVDAEASETDQPAIGIGGGGAGAANSVETDQPMFKFNGFGSLGVSHSSQSLGDYVLDRTVPKGAGRSNDWSASNDSRIAASLTANFTPKVSAILQVISDYQADGTYRPTIEWANVKYAFTPDAYIRVGRIVLPTFLDSNNRDVGYSYPWLHPPVDLYRQQSIFDSDGIDAMYRFEIGSAENSIKAIYGRDTLDFPTSVSTSKGLRGIFDTLEYGSATFHVGYQKRESSSLNLLTGVTGAWTQNTDLSVGASYDPGNWFAMSEWIQRRSTIKVDAMYFSAGYRVDKFTPYLTYSQDSPASFLPGSPAPTATAIQNAKKSQSTVSLGVRWDFMKNTDFKLQYDLVKLGDQSNGNLANVPAGVILYGTKFHVISAVVDFVF
jgi:hypothetical protein